MGNSIVVVALLNQPVCKLPPDRKPPGKALLRGLDSLTALDDSLHKLSQERETLSCFFTTAQFLRSPPKAQIYNQRAFSARAAYNYMLRVFNICLIFSAVFTPTHASFLSVLIPHSPLKPLKLKFLHTQKLHFLVINFMYDITSFCCL